MEYRYIDTHAHVNLAAFVEDRADVILRAREAGVAMINVGTQADTSRKAVEVAMEADGCYATVGLHPVHTSASFHDAQELGEEGKEFTSRGEVFDANVYRGLAKNEKVVAIGECGLDYYRLEEGTRERQEAAFIAQIELANELRLPLMIHTREPRERDSATRSVYDDTVDILKRHARVPGNIHFYAGTYEQAKRFFEIGFTVSFTGVITFTDDYNETVKNAPLSMIHAETDCPYVAPVPYRGTRNEPMHVREVYKRIAAIRAEDEEVVRAELLENARRLYGIKM